MEAQPSLDPLARAECRETLVRELLLRTFAHDVRGAVMGVMGWAELATMEGLQLPSGLGRSLDRLTQIVTRYDEIAMYERLEDVDLGVLLPQVLGITPTGQAVPARVSTMRLVSALELAAPERAELSEEQRGGRTRVRLRLTGLPPEGVQLAMVPNYEDLATRIHERSRALGCCLLRVVARSSGGELRGQPPAQIDLLLPAA